MILTPKAENRIL